MRSGIRPGARLHALDVTSMSQELEILTPEELAQRLVSISWLKGEDAITQSQSDPAHSESRVHSVRVRCGREVDRPADRGAEASNQAGRGFHTT